MRAEKWEVSNGGIEPLQILCGEQLCDDEMRGGYGLRK